MGHDFFVFVQDFKGVEHDFDGIVQTYMGLVLTEGATK